MGIAVCAMIHAHALGLVAGLLRCDTVVVMGCDWHSLSQSRISCPIHFSSVPTPSLCSRPKKPVRILSAESIHMSMGKTAEGGRKMGKRWRERKREENQ